MYIYTIIEAVAAVIGGILLAVCTQKADDVVYGKLDRAGRITNIVLLVLYICASPLYLFFGSLGSPAYEGFLGFLGWVVCVIMASAALFCGLGLGFSVLLRKKGKSKESFVVQFAGMVGIGLSVGLYCIFAGNLLRFLN